MIAPIEILIVDDSPTVRHALTEIFSSEEDLQVIGAVGDPFEAAKFMRTQVPDVITLDIEMPRMDGLTFLQKLMKQHPLPVVVISTLTERGTETAIKALEYGAAEIIAKPKLGLQEDIQKNSQELIRTVRAAARANLSNLRRRPSQSISTPSASGNVGSSLDGISSSRYVIALGASTGGTEVLKQVLLEMPENAPGIVIVQHMPKGFTEQFANRLDHLCRIEVKEAEDGDLVLPGRALIARGDAHLTITRTAAGWQAHVGDQLGLVNRHMPSVDVLFDSVAKHAGKNAVACLMTGMGKDGAQGLLEIRNSGGQTMAQDQVTSVVFGMPRQAIELGATDRVLPADKIGPTILDLIKSLASK